MSNPRSIQIVSLPTKDAGHFIDVRIYFGEGSRSYVLCIDPVEHKSDGSWSMMMMSGKSLRIEQASRFSAKRLSELAMEYHTRNTIVATLIQQVLDKEGRELA